MEIATSRIATMAMFSIMYFVSSLLFLFVSIMRMYVYLVIVYA
jgi:hypothetical protein